MSSESGDARGIVIAISGKSGCGNSTVSSLVAFFILVAFVILAVSGKFVKPLIGQDVMPPMDTGIIKINFEADSNSSLLQATDIPGGRGCWQTLFP